MCVRACVCVRWLDDCVVLRGCVCVYMCLRVCAGASFLRVCVIALCYVHVCACVCVCVAEAWAGCTDGRSERGSGQGSERPRDAASAYGTVKAPCDFINASPAAQNGESHGFGGGWCVNERKCGNPWFPPARSNDVRCKMTLRSAAARPARSAGQAWRCTASGASSGVCRVSHVAAACLIAFERTG